MKGRLLLAAMVIVTAWSVWAFAQPQPPHPGGQGGPGRPAPLMQLPGPGKGPMGQMPQLDRGMVMPGGTGAQQSELQRAAAEHAAEQAEEARKKAEEEKEENAPPADINWVDFGRDTPPYLAMVINAGILFAGYYFFGRKPIAAALKARRDGIARDIEEAQKMRREAEKRAKVYQAKLERLESEMATTREALVRAGEAERERLVQEAEAKADRMRKDAEFQVEQELKQLRVDLQRDTVEAAIAAAEELLKKRVTPADQERLAEDYLADLARAPAGSMGGAS